MADFGHVTLHSLGRKVDIELSEAVPVGGGLGVVEGGGPEGIWPRWRRKETSGRLGGAPFGCPTPSVTKESHWLCWKARDLTKGLRRLWYQYSCGMLVYALMFFS